MMNPTPPPPDDGGEWEKPSIYSVLVIALVLGLIGWGVHIEKLTFTEGLVGSLIGVLTWVTRGARPPIANKIGPKPPTSPDPLPMVITPVVEEEDRPTPRAPTSNVRRVAAAFCLLSLTACTPGGKQTAKDVLSLINVACVIANATSDDATILQVCDVTTNLLPSVRTILGEHRKALAKAQRAGCGAAPAGDAGAP